MSSYTFLVMHEAKHGRYGAHSLHDHGSHVLVCSLQADTDGENEDGYGSDLMGNDEDRMKLSAMTELEREMILAERADARDAARERQRAEKSLKQAQEQQQRAAEKVMHAFTDEQQA